MPESPVVQIRRFVNMWIVEVVEGTRSVESIRDDICNFRPKISCFVVSKKPVSGRKVFLSQLKDNFAASMKIALYDFRFHFKVTRSFRVSSKENLIAFD